jgi:Cu/Ag efflux protein CusF
MSAHHLTKITAGVAALGLAASLGAAGTAVAATKPKPKPKTVATKTKATKVASDHAAGVLRSVDVKADRVVVTVGKAADTFTTTSATKVTLAGKTAALTSLKAGDKVTVTYTHTGKVLRALSIAATS